MRFKSKKEFLKYFIRRFLLILDVEGTEEELHNIIVENQEKISWVRAFELFILEDYFLDFKDLVDKYVFLDSISFSSDSYPNRALKYKKFITNYRDLFDLKASKNALSALSSLLDYEMINDDVFYNQLKDLVDEVVSVDEKFSIVVLENYTFFSKEDWKDFYLKHYKDFDGYVDLPIMFNTEEDLEFFKSLDPVCYVQVLNGMANEHIFSSETYTGYLKGLDINKDCVDFLKVDLLTIEIFCDFLKKDLFNILELGKGLLFDIFDCLGEDKFRELLDKTHIDFGNSLFSLFSNMYDNFDNSERFLIFEYLSDPDKKSQFKEYYFSDPDLASIRKYVDKGITNKDFYNFFRYIKLPKDVFEQVLKYFDFRSMYSAFQLDHYSKILTHEFVKDHFEDFVDDAKSAIFTCLEFDREFYIYNLEYLNADVVNSSEVFPEELKDEILTLLRLTEA